MFGTIKQLYKWKLGGKKQMLILVIIAIILVVSFGINMYVEENNKEITKEFIEELEKQNELLKDQNRYLKNLRK